MGEFAVGSGVDGMPSAPASFVEDGYMVVRGLFEGPECDEILTAVQSSPFQVALATEHGTPGDAISCRPLPHAASAEARRWVCDPRWEPIVGALIEDPSGIRVLWDEAVEVAPGAPIGWPWRQDHGAIPLDPADAVSCVVALDDASAGRAAPYVLPGSHRVGPLVHRLRGAAHHLARDLPDHVVGVEVPLRRGDVLVCSSLLVHRTGPNSSGSVVRSWSVQFCGADASLIGTGSVVDDRLLVLDDAGWIEDASRARDLDLTALLGGYEVPPGDGRRDD